ncbi:mechanosensitive ion channel domain-containing protein [Nitrosopumilus sp.]|uniref:mechanosensitive ion channel domain-containing protein n=1 Tax=Nitrosopumilus sp. TaxID=2024843 RepID=UPI0034A08392
MDSFYIILVSIIISAILLFTTRYIINKKMKNLAGTQKLTGLITIIIIISEIAFLGSFLGLFKIALEVITSIGVGMVVLGIALQHQLKNIAAGIGVFLNPDINVGDSIKINETHGIIIEIHLTKIVALTEDGGKIIIPCQKLAEDFVIVYNKQRRSH